MTHHYLWWRHQSILYLDFHPHLFLEFSSLSDILALICRILIILFTELELSFMLFNESWYSSILKLPLVISFLNHTKLRPFNINLYFSGSKILTWNLSVISSVVAFGSNWSTFWYRWISEFLIVFIILGAWTWILSSNSWTVLPEKCITFFGFVKIL